MSIVKTYSLRIATLLAALLISVSVTAQEYRYEAGIGGGISGYLGDVNQSNVLKHPGFAGNALFRYLINKRFAVKADFTVASISGNSDDFANKFPDNAHYEFSHTYFDLGVAFEFNFLNFGMNDDYRKLKRISPYLSLGLGLLTRQARISCRTYLSVSAQNIKSTDASTSPSRCGQG